MKRFKKIGMILLVISISNGILSQDMELTGTLSNGGAVISSGEFTAAGCTGLPAAGAAENDVYRMVSGSLLLTGYESTGIPEDVIHNPDHFILMQNSPNPFNSLTTIPFSLPQKGHVNLTVYNLSGRKVGHLLDENVEAGNHTIFFDAGHLSSGIYVYELKSDRFRQIRKMILLK